MARDRIRVQNPDTVVGSESGQQYRRGDELFRERWRAASRAYYWRHREKVLARVKARAREVGSKRWHRSTRYRTAWRKVPLLVGGRRRMVYVYTTQQVARDMGITMHQWYHWLRNGVLPPLTVRTSYGVQFVTEDQHDLLVDSVAIYHASMRDNPKARGVVAHAALRRFSRLVWARWLAIPDGVGDAWRAIRDSEIGGTDGEETKDTPAT